MERQDVKKMLICNSGRRSSDATGRHHMNMMGWIQDGRMPHQHDGMDPRWQDATST